MVGDVKLVRPGREVLSGSDLDVVVGGLMTGAR